MSEEVGFKKPHPNIFLHSLQKTNAKPEESLMIGDNLDVDIAGAQGVNIDQVYYNPNKIPHQKVVTFEISSLAELKNIL